MYDFTHATTVADRQRRYTKAAEQHRLTADVREQTRVRRANVFANAWRAVVHAPRGLRRRPASVWDVTSA